MTANQPVSMDPKDYNTVITAEDTIVGGVYRSECNGMIVRIGEYAESGTPKFVLTGSTSPLRVSPFSHETLYAQDPPAPAMPEGAVRLGDLKRGDCWIRGIDELGINREIIRHQLDNGETVWMNSGRIVKPLDPDTPVFPIIATYRLRGTPEPETKVTHTCFTCNDQFINPSDAYEGVCANCYHTPSRPNWTPKQPDAAPKGKRRGDLKYLETFLMEPWPLTWTAALRVVHHGSWGGEYLHSKHFRKIDPDQIVYPVKVTCELKGTE